MYILIGNIYHKAKKKTKDPVAHFGFILLFYSMISMIIFLIFVVLDTIMITFTDHPGYTIFMYFAWIFVISFFVLNYFSLVMPNWLEKRIKK